MENTNQTKPTKSRREFLANLILGLGTACGLGALAWRFAQFLYPVVPPVKRIKVRACKIGEVPENDVRVLTLPHGPVMLSRAGSTVRALSGICAHLGCVVQWRADLKQFVCPCHRGVYDIAGNVVSGPPPRPLQLLEVTLQGDQVLVQMEERQKAE